MTLWTMCQPGVARGANCSRVPREAAVPHVGSREAPIATFDHGGQVRMRWFSGFTRPTPCSVPTFWPSAFQSSPYRTHSRVRVPRGWCHREAERQVAGHEHQRPSNGWTGNRSVGVRSESRQGRADARFVRGMWLGKTTESDEHLFATVTGVYTPRTVKRVPDTEQRRADLVKKLQGTPWDRLAGRPAGRPRKTALQAPPVATPPAAKASERPSEDASERRSAKAQDLNPPAVPHVIPVPRAADTENEPSSACGPTDTDHGGAQVDPASDDHVQVRSSTPDQTNRDDRTNQGGKRNLQPASQPEQTESNVSPRVKGVARAAELPDEDEHGGKFQQVEG